MGKLTALDKKILHSLAKKETKLAAKELGISEDAIYAHLYKIRRNRVQWKKDEDTLRAFERQSPRLKKKLMPTE